MEAPWFFQQITTATPFNIIRISDGVSSIPGYQPELSENEKAWRQRRIEKKLPADCGCAIEEVAECFLAPEKNAAIASQGIRDILDRHFGNLTEYTEAAQDTLAEMLMLLKIKSSGCFDHLYYPQMLQERYEINWHQAHALLSRMDLEGWIEHGSGIRCCWLSETGQDYMAKLKGVTMSRKDELFDWCAANQDILGVHGKSPKKPVVPGPTQ